MPWRCGHWVSRLALLGSLAAIPAYGASSVLVLTGKGVQVYDCRPSAAGYDWQLKAPDAVLLDGAGHAVGHHFAGPTWQADDGSTIVGNALVASQSPQRGSVAWLVLAAKAHGGMGVFDNVAYVVRSDTVGGAAPADGCDAAHAGGETRVGYSATYTFFPG